MLATALGLSWLKIIGIGLAVLVVLLIAALPLDNESPEQDDV